ERTKGQNGPVIYRRILSTKRKTTLAIFHWITKMTTRIESKKYRYGANSDISDNPQKHCGDGRTTESPSPASWLNSEFIANLLPIYKLSDKSGDKILDDKKHSLDGKTALAINFVSCYVHIEKEITHPLTHQNHHENGNHLNKNPKRYPRAERVDLSAYTVK